MTSPRMLEGYRVLDLSQFIAGPVCTSLLAEMGADVIKLEIAPSGDRTRTFGLKPGAPEHRGSTHSSSYFQHNHTKRSIALDMKTTAARELALGMAAKVDVVVENFAPGVMARLGLSYEDIQRVNPTVIMCSISLAGQTGPLSDRPGYDYIGQAYAGVTDLIGEPDRAPAMANFAGGDVSTGVAAAMGIGFALLHRERTGEGQYLDASLVDTYFHMLEYHAPMIAMRGEGFQPTRQGSVNADSPTMGIYPCGDGYVLLCALPHQWQPLAKALGMAGLEDDARFATISARRKYKSELEGVLRGWFASFDTRDAAIAALEAERVPVAPVLSVSEAMRHPHLNARNTVRWIDDPQLGRVAIPGVPVKFSSWPDRTELRSARLGEDNEAVLSELAGLSADDIADLYRSGVLVRDPTLAPQVA